MQSSTRTQSANDGVPSGGFEGHRDTKTRYPCDHPGCLKTFSRPQDIPRHKSSVHNLSDTRYPCPLVGDHDCSREDGFPRKDKLVAHLRQRHKVPVSLQSDAFSIDGSQDKPTGASSFRESYPLGMPSSPKGALGKVEIDHHPSLNASAGGITQYSHANPLSKAAPSLSGLIQLPNNTLGRNTANNNHSRYQYPGGGYRQAPYLLEAPVGVDGYGARNAGGFTSGNIHESISGIMAPTLFQLSGPRADVHWTIPGPFQQEKPGPTLHRAQPHGATTASIPTSTQHTGLAENGQFRHSTEYPPGDQSYWTSYGPSPPVSSFSLQQHQRPLNPPLTQQETPGAPSMIRLLPILETALDSAYGRQSEKGYKQDQSFG
jgi:hypothetical protein